MALQREQSAHNAKKAALKYDGAGNVLEVKSSPRLPPERFGVYKDGKPVRGWELRRVDDSDPSGI